MIPRYRAIEKILEQVESEDVVLSTTGMISREVFQIKDRPGNFYMLGSMGLLSSFGLGLALLQPDRRVFVLEGDGSALMSLGTLPLIATEQVANLIHLVLDNEAYESTGGQPSISADVDLSQIAKNSGYRHVVRVDDIRALEDALTRSRNRPGPQFILAKVGIAPVPDISRVNLTPIEIRDRFTMFLESQKN